MRRNQTQQLDHQPLTITLGEESYSWGAGGADEDRGDDFEADGADASAQAAADKIAADTKAAEDAVDAAKALENEGKSADELADQAEEETAEEKAEREAEEAKAAQKRRVRIPLERHDAVVAAARQREEALAARIRELEQGTAAPSRKEVKDVLSEMRTSLEEMQDKYEAHLFAGEKDEAKVVRKELEAAREAYTDQKVAASSNATRAQTIDSLKFEAALAKVEGDFPTLNPDNEAFEDAKANEVAEMMSMFVQNGLTRQASLEKAVKYVMGSPAARAAAGKDTAAETLRVAREKAAREKAATANGQQPPDSNKAGADNDKAGTRDGTIDVMKLDQDKFAKLDEETVARMRGDTV